ncbi:hypothetical protein G3A_14150 [Bacillus sp. 17376]|uniref:Uncharacterized protein n=1 Tax=Mesobacillus boroniphilus JCM 21738 TaxID=1294265 RepID=W4RVB5_9BACI|nr:hypothetical protein [Mesobacillus boroniphilus]ESU31893.1 hypothetical protein G3A_14150 [Bacillus sp. 17376]GAE47589.1 hypothetical protein JCM21738_4585 [Mesobacillus boroniphilus JCM 21738]
MRKLENDLISKIEVVELKKEVISILHSIQFDNCYHVEDCILDLHKLLIILDDMEVPQRILLETNQTKLTKEALSYQLKEKHIL